MEITRARMRALYGLYAGAMAVSISLLAPPSTLAAYPYGCCNTSNDCQYFPGQLCCDNNPPGATSCASWGKHYCQTPGLPCW